MALDTVIQQGTFTSTGVATTLAIRSDWDWMRVINLTALAQAAADLGYDFYFQRGMTDGEGILWTKLGTVANDPVTVGAIAANAGFFYVDSSVITVSAAGAVAGVTAANPPVVNSVAHGLKVGNIVRLSNLDGQPQIGGIEFSITAVGDADHFTLGNINMVGSVASAAGSWRKISYDPMFVPAAQNVTYVENAAQPKVYFARTHNFTQGQQVRLNFPGGSAIWGNYAQLNGVQATVLNVGVARAGNEPNNGGTANNIQIDIDTSGYGTWTAQVGGGVTFYPAAADVPFSPANVVPIGANTATVLANSDSALTGAELNQAFIGVTLQPGNSSPAGNNNDVIYWMAGKSFSTNIVPQ